FFYNDPPPTHTYTLSLHDALPICRRDHHLHHVDRDCEAYALRATRAREDRRVETDEASRQIHQRTPRIAGIDRRIGLDEELIVGDRKSTRLNSSHSQISYAVFCLK